MRDWSASKAWYNNYPASIVPVDAHLEAIAEIEQLRQELETQNQIRSEAMGEIGRLRQEKAELVEALKELIDECKSYENWLEAKMPVRKVKEIAVKVLAKHERSDSE